MASNNNSDVKPTRVACKRCGGIRFEVLRTVPRVDSWIRRRACLDCGHRLSTSEREIGTHGVTPTLPATGIPEIMLCIAELFDAARKAGFLDPVEKFLRNNHDANVSNGF